ncbi:MAG: hypothetical protein NZ853_04220 [Leptospiraceae bacterium]|nr:hypothetical protein [Leptospiraceae bacterium]MDW7975379.1 hypothetical protein [Leptospiraceae bacterium]
MIIKHLKEHIVNPISIGTLALGVAIGAITTNLKQKECNLQKPSLVILKDQQQKQGNLIAITSNEVILSIDEKKEVIPFSSILRVILYENEMNLERESFLNSHEPFIGTYKLWVGGHEGFLTIYKTSQGSFGGYVEFPNWGKGKKEILSFVQIAGNQIQFMRSCYKESCKEIGSPYEFRQSYIGYINSKREIEGRYTGTHSSGTWKAIPLKN